MKIKAGNRNVEVTNSEKILFPKAKISKLELINYYQDISDLILPFLKDRPLTLVRCPNGILKDCFYQKDSPDYYPDWIDLIPVEKSNGSIINYINCNSKATLAYIINKGAITLHPWLSKTPELNSPDKIIFDLDPSPEVTFEDVKKTALKFKETLDNLKLTSFVMATGSKGLHVIIPIKSKYHFDHIREYAKNIAQELVNENPELLTLEIRKEKRKGKIFLDYLRNAWSATSVAPYSVRNKENAPIAMPISWDQVKNKLLKPDQFNIKNYKKHLSHAWDDFFKVKNKIKI